LICSFLRNVSCAEQTRKGVRFKPPSIKRRYHNIGCAVLLLRFEKKGLYLSFNLGKTFEADVYAGLSTGIGLGDNRKGCEAGEESRQIKR
jgi:hypothetical protein